MKKQSRKTSSVVGIIVTFTVVWFCATVSADTHYFVQMKANPAGDKLVILTNKRAAGCPAGNFNKGCVTAVKKEGLQITFLLAGKSSCEHDDDSGNWKMKRVYLGGYDSASKPAAFGFGSATEDEWDQVDGDFDVADKATGLLNLMANPNDRTIVISDANNFSKFGYDVWYQVQADCVDDDDKVLKIFSTDPRIRNGGTG